MKPVDFDPYIYKELKNLKLKDSKLFDRINQKLKLFKQNPKHKSLRLHKLTKVVENTWSISINKSLRMIFIDKEDSYYFIKLGTHDQVYRK